MNNEYPTFFARFYDLVYHQNRDGVDNDYFQNLVKESKGKVLEIGVGTGRLFLNALQSGADIYGLDISQSMIDILSKKLDTEQFKRISRQNIIDFNYDFKFDLIIAPFRVMMHLHDKHGQIRAINNAYKHLNENGLFVFDAFVPDLNQLINGLDNIVDFQGEYESGKKIRRIVSTKPDLINQLINITFRLEWDENNEWKTEKWETSLHYFFLYELEHLIERTKFEHYEILGDFNGNKLNSKSKEFIAVCRKTEN